MIKPCLLQALLKYNLWTAQITILQSLNDALAPIHMEVSATTAGPPGEADWAVRDGRSLTRFTDDMVRVSFRLHAFCEWVPGGGTLRHISGCHFY